MAKLQVYKEKVAISLVKDGYYKNMKDTIL